MSYLNPKCSNTVLVVEDDADALDEMSEALWSHGLSVLPVPDGETALKVAKKFQPSFVLMDYNLPGINGLKTVSAIRKLLPGVTFIMISGHDDFYRRATTKNAGVLAVLKKPVSMNGIARFIRNKLDCTSSNLSVTEMLTA